MTTCAAIFVLALMILQAHASDSGPVETRFKVTGTVTDKTGRYVTLVNVAKFVPRRLGEEGFRKLHAAFREKNIEYHTTEFAAATLMVLPDQAALARDILKDLIATDKLPIKLLGGTR